MNDRRVQAAVAALVLGGLGVIGAALYRMPPSSSISTGSPHGVVASTHPAPTVDVKTKEIRQLAMHLKSKPGHTPILFRMAQLSLELGKLTDAAEHLRAILREEPENVDARLELAKVLYESGDAEGAIAETNLLLERDTKNVDALYNLGAIYANQGNSSLAREYWAQAVSIDARSESGQKAQRGLEQLASIPGG